MTSGLFFEHPWQQTAADFRGEPAFAGEAGQAPDLSSMASATAGSSRQPAEVAFFFMSVIRDWLLPERMASTSNWRGGDEGLHDVQLLPQHDVGSAAVNHVFDADVASLALNEPATSTCSKYLNCSNQSAVMICDTHTQINHTQVLSLSILLRQRKTSVRPRVARASGRPACLSGLTKHLFLSPTLHRGFGQ